MTTPDDPRDIFSDETERIGRADAISMDVAAGRAVADAVRTTLGPRGMDKILIDDEGDFVVTNDGITVLRQMRIDHPAANVVAEAADTQETAVGDGTTTAVVLAGELLREAERLLERGLHQQAIASGFAQAATHARDSLADLSVGPDDDLLEQTVATALTGKGDGGAREHLTPLVVDAVHRVRDEEGEFDADAVTVEPIVGGTVRDSTLADGFAVGQKPAHPAMPTDLRGDLSVALVEGDLVPPQSRTDVEVVVDDADDLEEFYERETAAVDGLFADLQSVAPDAVFVGGTIDEALLQRLADEGIVAVRQLPRDDLEALARATGGAVVDVDALSAADLGSAGRLEQWDTGRDTHLFVEDVPVGRSVTFFLRGGTRRVVDELERAVEDAFRAVETVGTDGQVVPGAGATEVELARSVRAFADTISGRAQLAATAYADALEVVPKTLAQTAGLNPVDALLDLRAAHAGGRANAGVDVVAGEIADAAARGILDPAGVKRQALDSATEAAMLLLRVEEVIVAGDLVGGSLDAPDELPAETSEETVQQNREFIDGFQE